jgi:GxxExxY protein
LHSIAFEIEVPVPLVHKECHIGCGYRLDLLVANTVIIEAKSVDHLLPIHEAQILTYLKLMKIRLG